MYSQLYGLIKIQVCIAVQQQFQESAQNMDPKEFADEFNAPGIAS